MADQNSSRTRGDSQSSSRNFSAELARTFRQVRVRTLILARRQTVNFRQSIAAILISSGGDLLAGLGLGFMTGTMRRLPGLILLVPAAIGMRGNIFGALGSRLGTQIHTGEFRGRLEKGSAPTQNILASAALTLYVSVALAILAREIARFFGVQTIPVFDYMVISVVGGVLSSVVVLAITLAVAVLSVRRGWDMDNVSAPLVTAAGDLVTLPSLWLATFLVPIRLFPEIVGAVSLAALVLLTYISIRVKGVPLYKEIIRQSLPILIVAGLIDVVAGLTIDRRIERFFAFPALFVLVPPFLEDAGALGGILSARLSSKLHLGVIRPRAFPELRSIEDIVLSYILALPVFTLVGVSGTLVSAAVGMHSPGLLRMVSLTLLAGAIATSGAVFVAYYTAVVAYRRGLDPDNYGIPAVTSSMDLIGAFALIFSMIILGVTK